MGDVIWINFVPHDCLLCLEEDIYCAEHAETIEHYHVMPADKDYVGVLTCVADNCDYLVPYDNYADAMNFARQYNANRGV